MSKLRLPFKHWLIFGISIALLSGVQAVSAPVARAAAATPVVTGLTSNARVNPLGIPADGLVFGWKTSSADRGVVQTGYQLQVGTAPGLADQWDSGQVTTNTQVDVPYTGSTLASQTRYYWRVKVWTKNAAGESAASDWASAWFETGILSTSEWEGDFIAKAAADMSKWANYTAEAKFKIEVSAFSLTVRAQANSDSYMWQIRADASPFLRKHVRIDNDWRKVDDVPLTGLGFTQAQLLSGWHTMKVKVASAGGTDTVTTWLDGTQIDQSNYTTASLGYDVTKLATGYVGFRSGLVDGGSGGETFLIDEITVTCDDDSSVLLSEDFTASNPFSSGTLTDGALRVVRDPEWTIYQPPDTKPLLRTTFTTATGKQITAARLYASARGVYEMRLNGEKVGDQFLAPGHTDYPTRIQAQTYDVTDQVLGNGALNSLGGLLGDGWYAGKIGWWGAGQNYGTTIDLIAQLRIDYADGTHQVVKTDNTWKAGNGPYTVADLIDGEDYDATKAQDGWDAAGFNDSAWANAVVATGSAGAIAKLVPQPDEPVRVTGEVAVKEAGTSRSGKPLYDLGQNMVGTIRVTMTGQAGQTVTFRYAEVLQNSSGKWTETLSAGELWTANFRGARVTDHYTFASNGTVTYTPKLTFHGFRYVEITGLDSAPAAAGLTGVVLGSDVAKIGTFTSSNAALNQLQSNIDWGIRGNFLSIPTDTPARDERLGWAADLNVVAPTATYNRDSRAFLAKWLADLRDAQQPDGNVPGVAPLPPAGCCGPGTGWSDVMITVPYALYDTYGDTAAVAANYAAMADYMDYLESHATGFISVNNAGGYGDWVNLSDPTSDALLGTAYFAENARMMMEMAAAIGNTADASHYEALWGDIRAAFAEEFIAADGTVSGNSQTGYAMALAWDLVPYALRDAVAAKYAAKIADSGDHFTTGFLGTPVALEGLSGSGNWDLAYQLLLRDEYPSWLYEVKMGATTMWELWNSISADGSFADPSMNSFNHYAYGAVGDWMYENIAGLQAGLPGYKQSVIAPHPGGGLTSAAGSLETSYGELSSSWQVTASGLKLEVSVPVNTTAEVRIPGDNPLTVTVDGELLTKSSAVDDIALTDDAVSVMVGSGSYTFEVFGELAGLATLSDELYAVKAAVSAAVAASNLAAATGASVNAKLESARNHVLAASEAWVAGNQAELVNQTQAALDDLVAAGEILGASSDPASTGLAETVRDAQLDASGELAAAYGVSVTLVNAGSAYPGASVTGQVKVKNTGTVELIGLRASVSIADWIVNDSGAKAAELAAGAEVSLPFTVTVPAAQGPGVVKAKAVVGLTRGMETLQVPVEADWLQVASPIAVSGVSGVITAGSTTSVGTLTAAVANAAGVPVTGQVWLTLPSGWAQPAVSAQVSVPASGSVSVPVDLFVPVDVIGGPNPVKAEFRTGSSTLASWSGEFTVNLAAPSGVPTTQYVDFGDGTSESAHGLLSSSGSGTNTEAGFTRRYSSSNLGSWFSAQVTGLTVGQPFLIVVRETWDRTIIKKYKVYVDSTEVATRVIPNTVSGAVSKVHQFLVDDPAALTSANPRIKFSYEEGGYGDASIADLWVIPVSAASDTLPPLVSAVPSTDAPGADGWSKGPVTVTLQAIDDSSSGVTIEYNLGSGWQTYTGPFTISGDGTTTYSYRASDSVNTSTPVTVTVTIDSTPPASTLSTSVDANGDVQLSLATTDGAGSGVAAVYYRIDVGTWTPVTGALPALTAVGAHVVEFFAVDQAGNVGPVETELVTVPPRTIPSFIPVISGTAKSGQTLTVTGVPAGYSVAYQWLRNSAAISGATASSYKLVDSDAEKQISVKVKLSKADYTDREATSAPVTVAKLVVLPTQTASFTPKISGTAAVGKTLKVTGAPAGWTAKYQWLRDGKAIKNATKASYKVTAADPGHKLSVKVTVSKAGATTTVKTSAAKSLAKLKAKLALKLPKAKAKKTSKLAITLTVAGQPKPAGKLKITVDGKAKTVTLAAAKKGKLSYTLPKLKKGSHKITVKWLGTKEISAISKSTTLKVK
jgi:hypothetical protein